MEDVCLWSYLLMFVWRIYCKPQDSEDNFDYVEENDDKKLTSGVHDVVPEPVWDNFRLECLH